MELFGGTIAARDRDQRARDRRLYALAAVLRIVRADRGWSVEVAAGNAGVGHMTWRRSEQGVPSRMKTYSAMDRLFDLAPGTVHRATRNDDLMVEFAGRMGVDITDADTLGSAEWVAKLAESAAAGTPAGNVVAPERPVEDRPELLRSLGLLAQHTPTARPTDLQVATDLVERMGRLSQESPDPDLTAAIQAVLKAVPHMIGVTVRDAGRELSGSNAAE